MSFFEGLEAEYRSQPRSPLVGLLLRVLAAWDWVRARFRRPA